MFTDSHCHLSFPELSNDLTRIRQEMTKASVTRALCICTTLEEFPRVHQLALDFDNFWATVGVHPDNESVTEPLVNDLVTKGSLPVKPDWIITAWQIDL
jgi:TatD DNase family protein